MVLLGFFAGINLLAAQESVVYSLACLRIKANAVIRWRRLSNTTETFVTS